MLETAISLERVARAHSRLLADAIRAASVFGMQSIEDFKLLALLRRNSTGFPQNRLAEILALTQGTTSTRVARLHKQGLLVSKPGVDRRSTNVSITAKGTEAVEQTFSHVSAAHSKLLGELTLADTKSLQSLLGKILQFSQLKD